MCCNVRTGVASSAFLSPSLLREELDTSWILFHTLNDGCRTNNSKTLPVANKHPRQVKLQALRGSHIFLFRINHSELDSFKLVSYFFHGYFNQVRLFFFLKAAFKKHDLILFYEIKQLIDALGTAQIINFVIGNKVEGYHLPSSSFFFIFNHLTSLNKPS